MADVSPTTWRTRVAAHLRAAFVVFHLGAIFVMAFPSPGSATKKSAWSDPTVQAELRAWSARLQGLGRDTSPAQLQDNLWDFVVRYDAARDLIMDPLRPYFRYTCTPQSWRMFVAPHRYPARLEILVEEQGVWRPVFVARSKEHTWQARALEHSRFRGAQFRFSWRAYRSQYKSFLLWARDRAQRDFPDATRVRTQLVKYRTLSPEEVLAGVQPEETVMLVQERRLRRAP